MANVGYATLSIIPSFQGLQSRLSAGVSAPMTAAGRDGGRRFGDAAGREAGNRFRSGWAERMRGFAPLAGLAVGAGALAFFKDAIDGASDLSESGNKINAIFGDAQEVVNEFASTASTNLGQTELQARDAASTFGTFGKAAGLAGDDLAHFSTGLVTLATDMASFYNTDVSTAIEAIGSGLRGEAEPLRQFGVLLDDATLRAEALRQGLVRTTSEALTPQQKVLAAHGVIMSQTADAQGDFARTSEGLANQQRILTARWEEMKTAVGEELLPAMTSFVGFLADDALPALGEAGGLAKDAVSAFRDLPAPVQAAAGAFVALRLAAATGLGTAAASGAASVASTMESVRLRTMLAADAFRDARRTTMSFSGNVGTVNQGVGRLSATMAGLRAAAQGAGGALRSGLSGAMSLLGGPWGVAFIGATAVVGKFWAEHQAAKQRVEDLTASLDKQTGAITDNTREMLYNTLEKSGALEAARTLGLNLDTVRSAAEGEAAAMRIVNEAIARHTELSDFGSDAAGGMGVSVDELTGAAVVLQGALGDSNSELERARDGAQNYRAFMGGAIDTTDRASEAMGTYADRLRDAREALQGLIDKENERRDSAVQSRRDQLALIETMAAAREEANKGRRTLDQNTKAGRENWNALLDLADQWNQSTDKVRNARGAYQDMRRTFIEVAQEMGMSRERARELADQFLKLPKRKDIPVSTPGIEDALAKVERLRRLAEIANSIDIRVQGSIGAHNAKLLGDGYATGGLIGGTGSGTSDSNLIWASRGEFMQRKAAVDYYGVEFMRRLNNLQIPKLPGYANGGLIEPRRATRGGGVSVNIGTVVARDYDDFMKQAQQRSIAVAGGGVTF